MKQYFITATGTGIGKTFVTSALTHQLKVKDKKIRTLKPIITGFNSRFISESDTGQLLQALGLPLSMENVERVSPWQFATPLSPDMAAEDESRTIDFDKLVSFSLQPGNHDYILIEGIGGVMTPLDKTHTVLDWMAALKMPIILVTGSALGSLSHTLAAVHAICSASLNLHAVVISASEQSTVSLHRNVSTLRRFLPNKTLLHTIARLDYYPDIWKYVPDLTSELNL